MFKCKIHEQMRSNRNQICLFRVHSSNMDMNGKQKITCSKKTSTNSFNSLLEHGEPISRTARTANGTDDISSNAVTGANSQRYLIPDPAQPIGEKSSLKRTNSQAIEQENGLHNEEFPEIPPIAVSENILLKNSGPPSKYLSSWDLMMNKRQKGPEKNSQERKR